MVANRIRLVALAAGATLACAQTLRAGNPPQPMTPVPAASSEQPVKARPTGRPITYQPPAPRARLAPTSAPATEESPAAAEPCADAEGESLPVRFEISYTLVTDYIFRGINFSEYEREGREKLNHQMATEIGFDLARFWGGEAGSAGELAAGAWFEWFAAQHELDVLQGQHNLQEIDYWIEWSYEWEALETTSTIGYVFYTLPNAKAFNTSEWYLGLEHNDAWAWRWLLPENEDGVLNPSFKLYFDTDINSGAEWFEFGLSHDFAVAEHLTVTPGVTFGVDHRWLEPVLEAGEGTTGLTNILWGLNTSYDLSGALKLDPRWGALTLSGFLNFSDAVGNARTLIEDEFYGGATVTWSF